MSTGETERLAELLAALPPVPTGWVEAAQELPAARRSLDVLLERALADRELRARLLADLERALAAEGIEATPAVVSLARIRLGELS
ncbi:MAG TPA: hypothetical protein VFA19_12845 [Gaiellaceae bacterium]|nr:hypothetical protein [Gaiellaceae bacterium]